jgi:hypothetical protein
VLGNAFKASASATFPELRYGAANGGTPRIKLIAADDGGQPERTAVHDLCDRPAAVGIVRQVNRKISITFAVRSVASPVYFANCEAPSTAARANTFEQLSPD